VVPQGGAVLSVTELAITTTTTPTTTREVTIATACSLPVFARANAFLAPGPPGMVVTGHAACRALNLQRV
jgi:hypothetical protein